MGLDPTWWNAAPGELYGDYQFYDYPDEDDDGPLVSVTCHACGGTGLAPEGWDCEYCDGEGELEV